MSRRFLRRAYSAARRGIRKGRKRKRVRVVEAAPVITNRTRGRRAATAVLTGAGSGALLGAAIAPRGHRSEATASGAAVGSLLGGPIGGGLGGVGAGLYQRGKRAGIKTKEKARKYYGYP